MNRPKSRLLLSFALAGAMVAPLAAVEPPIINEPNWMLVVGTYPQLGTPTSIGEVAVLSWLQRSRTSSDVARALAEAHPSLGCYAGVLSPPASMGATASTQGISLADFPKTAALLDLARADLMPILTSLQGTFARPQPSMSFPALMPAIPAQPGPSYPSTNAALGVVYARILSQFQPANRTAIMGVGAQLGTDRVMAGVHWPSDVEAGQRLGLAFADYWINLPYNNQMIKDCCCQEWHSQP